MAGGIPLHPRVRHLDIVPVDTEEGKAYLVRDPLELIAPGTCVPPMVLFLLGLMDGSRDLAALMSAVTAETGATIGEDQLKSLLADLEARLFLQGESFDAALDGVIRSFRDAPRRESIMAGRGLPDRAEPLRREILAVVDSEPRATLPPGKGGITGLVAPHLDLPRGRRCYSLAYGLLRQEPAPDLVLLLGTSHKGATSPLIPTAKPFASPMGEVPTADHFLARLTPHLDREALAQEFLHKDEHSLEFQVLFLQALYDTPPPIVPLLTGPLPEGPEGSPGGSDRVEGLVAALREAIAGTAGRVLVVAGADLAHVGPAFGQPDPLTDAQLEQLAAQDRASLELAAAGRAEDFWRHIAAGDNPRQVCGLSPMYLLLRILAESSCTLLGYHQAPAPDRSQCVSCAAMALQGPTSPAPPG